jgi:membrane protease YdiL (CAAX protease family)
VSDGERPDGLPPAPPAVGILSLDRPAAGLYVVAWLLCLAAAAFLFIGIFTQSQAARVMLVLAGFATFALGFGSAGGYQVIARSTRPAGAYRGPSPLLAFGFAISVSSALAGLLEIAPIASVTTAPGFLLGLLIVFVGYLATIMLLVVRTGVLGWPQLRRIRAATGGVTDFATGVAAGLLAVVPLLLFSALLATLLDVRGDQLPKASDLAGALALAAGVVVVAPVGEELFFRGFALQAWWRDLGAGQALIRSSLFFAVVHIANATGSTFGQAAAGGLVQFAVILPLAFLLGYLYERRGLPASIGAHMAYNGALLALALTATSLAP